MIPFGLILLLGSLLISHNIHLQILCVPALSLTNRLQILISMSQPRPYFVADIVWFLCGGYVWEAKGDVCSVELVVGGWHAYTAIMLMTMTRWCL